MSCIAAIDFAKAQDEMIERYLVHRSRSRQIIEAKRVWNTRQLSEQRSQEQ